jgi:hypothetical protein
MVLYLLWAIATVLQNYGDRPYFTTIAPAIAFTLPTHRVIAMLKQNLGHGDHFSAAVNVIASVPPMR